MPGMPNKTPNVPKWPKLRKVLDSNTQLGARPSRHRLLGLWYCCPAMVPHVSCAPSARSGDATHLVRHHAPSYAAYPKQKHLAEYLCISQGSLSTPSTSTLRVSFCFRFFSFPFLFIYFFTLGAVCSRTPHCPQHNAVSPLSHLALRIASA